MKDVWFHWTDRYYSHQDVPGGPVLKHAEFPLQGHGFDPQLGN